jgi:hypothetical protein
MAARAVVALVAVVFIGWLAVLERDTRLQDRAAANSRHGASQAQLAQAASDLKVARLLNPDTTPDVARAVVYRTAGRDALAASTIADVVRREPDNLLAWGIVFAYAVRRDPATAARALEQRRRLDPLHARPTR